MPALKRELDDNTLRILLADDHEVVRRGVRTFVESQPGWHVISEAANGREAVERAARLLPDVLIIDLSMPEVDGLTAIRRVHDVAPEIEILVLTYHDSIQMVRRAFEAGVRGYVLKSDAASDLVAAIHAVRHHEYFLSPRLSRDLPQTFGPESASS